MKDKKAYKKIGAITAVTFIVFAFGAFVYVSTMRDMILTSVMRNLTEIVELTKQNVNTKIANKIENLTTLARLLENEEYSDDKKLIPIMRKACEGNQYIRMGIADPTGLAYTSDNQIFSIQDRAYFISALQGKPSVSAVLEDRLSDGKIQVYAVPLYRDDAIRGVLFATINSTIQEEILSIANYQNKGFSVVFDKQGDVVYNDFIIEDEVYTNVYDLQFSTEMKIQDMENAKTGAYRFNDKGGEEWIFVYTQMDNNDGYISYIIPASVVSSQLNRFIMLAVISWAGVVLIFTMIMLYIYVSRVKSKQDMDKLVYHDSLTNHYNYYQFQLNIEPILAESSTQLQYALLEFDICGFKLFNELYGYQVGDEALKITLLCMEYYLKKEEYCARISADRFILLWKRRDEEGITARMKIIFDNIRKQLSSKIDGVTINFHVGVYLLEGKESDFAKNHDRATYAKNMIQEGQEDAVAFFSEEMYKKILADKILENRMEEALLNNEFQVYMQPKIKVSNQQIQSAEALVRWMEPSRGLLSPGVFIPMFEKNGFLQKLDMYVIQEVCAWLAQRKADGLPLIEISVNVSRSYIFKRDFVKNLKQMIMQYGIEPHYIEIEITESIILNRVDELKSIIDELQAYGFRIAMDDFGSGYSSLNMLKDIPIQVIKLDQAFFQSNAMDEKRSYLIIKGVIELAKILGLQIVAEGIERKEQVQFLSENACDLIQGYYFYKPMTISDFEQLLGKKEAQEK